MTRSRLAVVFATLLICATSFPAAADSEEDSKFGAWSPATNLGGTINTTFDEFGPGLTPDGKSLYFTSNRPGGVGLSDLWVAQRANKNAPWGAPMNLGAPVNSTAMDSVPSFTRDGHWMFFLSDRVGGFGSLDIWVSFRANPNDDFAWQSPTHLPAPINTAFFDAGAVLIEEGNTDTLYFNSDRLGTHDFYTSVRQADGSFGTPTLVTALNSTFGDQRLTIRKDRREVFFFSNRTGSAGNDLWTSTRDDRDGQWGPPTVLGSAVNSVANDTQATLSRDALMLVFASNRTGSVGGFDLYVTTRTKGD
jgi:hypothetical protein